MASLDVISKLATLGVTVVTARLLGPENFGLLALAMIAFWLAGAAARARSLPNRWRGTAVFVAAVCAPSPLYFLYGWHGLAVVGIYAAAFAVADAMRVFPAAIVHTVFPELSRANSSRPLWRLVALLTCVGALVTACTVLVAPSMVALLYGAAYTAAAPVLQVLGLAVPLFYVNYALASQLMAWQGDAEYATISIVALVTTIVVNVVLVPSQGAMGGAWAALLTELVVMIGCVLAFATRGATAHGPAGR